MTEQHNPAGLSYTYGYENNAVVITDSLNRREVLYTEGDGGLKRVIKEEKADGSAVTREFDNAGRMVAMSDAAGRKTEYRLNIGSGNVTSPGGMAYLWLRLYRRNEAGGHAAY